MESNLQRINYQVNSFVDKLINNFDKLDVLGKHSELKERLIQSKASNEKLKICMVGQYSAGKSSIVKMLTGDDSIKIAADIATSEAFSYDWKEVLITDTPGVDTGLNADHDMKTQQAITESDMLIFVITNELFDTNGIAYFKKLAYDYCKCDSMILVINKMDRAAQGNSPEMQEIIKSGLSSDLGEKTPENFYICFTAADSYNKAQKISNDTVKQKLLERSGYDNFVNQLDRFIEEKGLISKLCHPLFECREVLDILEYSYAGIGSYDIDGMTEEIEKIKQSMRDLDVDVQESSQMVENRILSAGQAVANSIQLGCSPESVANAEFEQMKNIKNGFDNAVAEIHNKYANIGSEYGIDIPLIEKKISSNNTEYFCVPSDTTGMLANVDDNVQNISKLVNGITNMAEERAVRLGEAADAAARKTGFWGSVFNTKSYRMAESARKAADSAAGTADFLKTYGAAGVAIARLAARAWQSHKEQKAKEMLAEKRAEVMRAYHNRALEAQDAFMDVASKLKENLNCILKDYISKKSNAELEARSIAENVRNIVSCRDEINMMLASVNE